MADTGSPFVISRIIRHVGCVPNVEVDLKAHEHSLSQRSTLSTQHRNVQTPMARKVPRQPQLNAHFQLSLRDFNLGPWVNSGSCALTVKDRKQLWRPPAYDDVLKSSGRCCRAADGAMKSVDVAEGVRSRLWPPLCIFSFNSSKIDALCAGSGGTSPLPATSDDGRSSATKSNFFNSSSDSSVSDGITPRLLPKRFAARATPPLAWPSSGVQEMDRERGCLPWWAIEGSSFNSISGCFEWWWFRRVVRCEKRLPHTAHG